MNRRDVLASTPVLLGGCELAQTLQLVAADRWADFEWSGPLPLQLPMRTLRGWALVEAWVNGRGPLSCVLDTGAAVSVLLAGPDLPGLDMRQLRRFGTADDLAAPTGAIQTGVELRIGPLYLSKHTLLAIPESTIGCREPGQPLPFQVVLGHTLFSRFAVELDPDGQEVRLHDARRLDVDPGWAQVPLTLHDRQPYVEAELFDAQGQAFRVKLHLDSGAESDLLLLPETDPRLVPQEPTVERAACFAGGQATHLEGARRRLRLAGLPPVACATRYAKGKEVRGAGQHGRLGAGVLQRFRVIVDYTGRRLLLRPRAQASTAGG